MCGTRGHRNGKTRTSLSTTTRPRLRSFKVSQFLAKNNMTVMPHPPYSPDLAPCDFFLFPKLQLRMKGRRDSRGIAAGTWHTSKKGLPGMLPNMAETLGPLYVCKRGVLWRWWRNLTSKISKLIFTILSWNFWIHPCKSVVTLPSYCCDLT